MTEFYGLKIKNGLLTIAGMPKLCCGYRKVTGRQSYEDRVVIWINMQ